MSETPVKAFFAYPSVPPSISEVIQTAIRDINSTTIVKVTSWEDLRKGGKIIITEICAQIDESQLFFADLTNLNPNVLFELGFAIARNKRIWLILDTTYSGMKKQFEQMRILTTVGYSPYVNVKEVVDGLFADQPYEDLEQTIFKQTIEPNLFPTQFVKLLHLKSRHELEASLRIAKLLKDQKIETIVDDPLETTVQTITWYGVNVFSSSGVLCHFTNPEREESKLINAKYAFVAGMAHGMNKPLLMICEGEALTPVDYRDLMKNYRTAAQAAKFVVEWLPTVSNYQKKEREKYSADYESKLKFVTELKGLNVGEYVAEREEEKLVEDYFIETAAYEEALMGNSMVFVGRKGSGKTANLIKLAADLKRSLSNLVCVIKPEHFEVQALTRLMKTYKERDKKGYAIESLWKFLIYSEIAIVVCDEIRNRITGGPNDEEGAFLSFVNQYADKLTDPFSIRLERAAESLLGIYDEENTIEEARKGVSEILHEGIIKELRIQLGKILTDRDRLAILIDNLDKAWDKQSDLDSIAEFLLGLISVIGRVSVDLKKKHSRRDNINVSLAVFLRSDIYNRIRELAQEPDKIRTSRLAWEDAETLLRVINERFNASREYKIEPEEIWKKYFCATVKGIPTRDYLIQHVLPRPRDLLFFVKASIATAINRKHSSVEESDVLESEKQYSQYALDTILVENGITVQALESILYEFAGSMSRLSFDELQSILKKANVEEEKFQKIIEHLTSLGFILIEVKPGSFRYSEDPVQLKKLIVMARKLSEETGQARFQINYPFHAFLEIT